MEHGSRSNVVLKEVRFGDGGDDGLDLFTGGEDIFEEGRLMPHREGGHL